MRDPPDDPRNGPAGVRVVLPCGHRVVMPWTLPPEVALADVVHHQSTCDLENGIPRLEDARAPSSHWMLAAEVL